MRQFSAWLLVSGLLWSAFTTAVRGQAYAPPSGGWTYIYTGDQALPGTGDFTALDGTWSHDNGSDSWDGTAIGTGSPGGVTGGLTDGDTVYARFQETGDPRDFGMPDPSNRKLFFGHNITAEGASDTILDDGVTISFRSRISTGGILDPQHPDGGGPITPWPEGGVGYNLHNGAKSTFTIRQTGNDSAVSFALGLPSSEGIERDALIMNNLNGDSVTGNVDGPDEDGELNTLAVSDATSWHEFWITIESNGDAPGTHKVQVWRDGTVMPATFNVTAGDGNDYDTSYLALGLGATPRMGAIDVDFFSWAPGAIPAADIPDLGDFDLDGVITTADYFILSDSLFAHLTGDVFFEDGDIDTDGDVDLDDFGQFKSLFPAVVAQAQGIPEPSSLVLLLITLLACLGISRKRRLSGLKGLTAVAAACVLIAFPVPSSAQVNVNWTAGTADYNVGGNWSTGAVPEDLSFNEVAVINNGGTAFVQSQVFAQPGGILLGQNTADSGTLEIRSGGQLTVVDGSSTNGDTRVGVNGQGTLRVLRGGTFNGDDLLSGGSANSLLVLGEVGGSGTATVNMGDDATLERTTRIIGPNVDFSVDDLTFTSAHNLIAEITGPTHSAITVGGTASLDGVLTVEFNGHTPAVGDRWALVRASRVQGGFSSIESAFSPGPGIGLFVDQQSDGMGGQIAELAIDARLQLSVDPNTGAAALQNLTTSESIDFDGYEIISRDSGLRTAFWTSIADGDANWRESLADSLRLGETNLSGSMVLGPQSSVGLGNIFDPAAGNAALDNVSFLYHLTGGRTIEGLLGLMELGGGGAVPGDYNNSSQVEQGDLDLVLLNWGSNFDTLPPEWINERPTAGIVDQAELDNVLLNWGNTAGAALGAASVPEPATWTVGLLVFLAVAVRRKLG